jgi:hypothetical protein
MLRFSLFSEAVPAWSVVTLVGALALAGLAGLGWYLNRARAERRWHDALDRYAEQEQTKEAHHGGASGLEPVMSFHSARE